MAKQLLTITEYAKTKGISRQAVYNQIKSGKIDTKIKGGKTYVSTHYSEVRINEDEHLNEATRELIEQLKKQIEDKDKQLNFYEGIIQAQTIQIKQLEYKPTISEKLKGIFKKQDN